RARRGARLDPDRARMRLADPLHDREADARRLPGRVHGVEHPEDALLLRLVEPHPVVAHAELEVSRVLAAGDDDLFGAAVLDRVRDQVLEDLRELRAVVVDLREGALDAQRAAEEGAERVYDLGEDGARVEALAGSLRRADARVAQHPVDELAHAPRALADLPQVVER